MRFNQLKETKKALIKPGTELEKTEEIIKKTFSPERQEVNAEVMALARMAEMGKGDKSELLMKITALTKKEMDAKKADPDLQHGVDSNIKILTMAVEKLTGSKMDEAWNTIKAIKLVPKMEEMYNKFVKVNEADKSVRGLIALKKQYDELTAENQHGEAALVLARTLGTSDDVELIQAINARHNKRGHISAGEQMLRDEIANSLYKTMMQGQFDLPESVNEDTTEMYKEVAKQTMKQLRAISEHRRMLENMIIKLAEMDKGVGDLTDQLTTMFDLNTKFSAVLRRAFSIVPVYEATKATKEKAVKKIEEGINLTDALAQNLKLYGIEYNKVLMEMDMKYLLINMQGKVQGFTSDEKDAKEMAKRTKSTMHPIKKKISDRTLEKLNALSRSPQELRDLGIIEEVDIEFKDDDMEDGLDELEAEFLASLDPEMRKKISGKNIAGQIRQAYKDKMNEVLSSKGRANLAKMIGDFERMAEEMNLSDEALDAIAMHLDQIMADVQEIEGIRETQEPVSEVTRQQSNKVNAMLSKVLGKINFTHFYNQKGGMFKLPTGVDHEVIVDPNDMKDAADLLMKDDGDAGFMFKQGKLRLVPADKKPMKEVDLGKPVTGSDNHIMGSEGHPVNLLKRVADQIAKDHADQDYTAIDELFKRTPSKELESFLSEFGESVVEKVEKMKMGDVIKDFQKSDAPQFKGKSKEKRRQMAIAAKLATQESKARKSISEKDSMGMNKYGLAAEKKGNKYISYKDGKVTGTFDSMEELRKHQTELIQNESIVEDDKMNMGAALQRAYDKVYDFVGEYDDDALEYLDDNAPIFSEMFDKYDGEFDVMASSLDANTLKQIMDELDEVASDLESGVLESKTKKPVAVTEAQFDEAAGKKDACYHKVKSRYKVWPSAYASGALVQCRKVGAKNWGNKSKKK